jgi:hypothetical protein
MDRGVRIISSKAIPKAVQPVQPSRGITGLKKFIPKKPERNEIGMNRVVMIVRVFITCVIRLLKTET